MKTVFAVVDMVRKIPTQVYIAIRRNHVTAMPFIWPIIIWDWRALRSLMWGFRASMCCFFPLFMACIWRGRMAFAWCWTFADSTQLVV